MKTALQEVFSRLEELHPRLFDIYTPEGRDFVQEFHKFMEVEKQQIKDAYIFSQIPHIFKWDAETYYNEIYKKDKL
jgi:hypothetical protein